MAEPASRDFRAGSTWPAFAALSRRSNGCRSSATATSAPSPMPSSACSRRPVVRASPSAAARLLNPWIFVQLCSWERTGHRRLCPVLRPTPRLHGAALQPARRARGERRQLQLPQMRRLVFARLEAGQRNASTDHDDRESRRIRGDRGDVRAKGPPPHWKAGELPEIAVPKGPISHWYGRRLRFTPLLQNAEIPALWGDAGT